jgi:heavy metal sensor kinase
MALSFLVGYFITARALKPVVEISKTAASLSITELSTRLKLPAAKDEIRDLTITFNGMIDRLEDAFGRLQRFSGDVSHELRTPIAVVRGEADFALRKKRTAEEYEDSLRVISKESVHMTSIIEDLLLLARAHSKSVAIQWEEIEPVSIVHGVKKALTTLMESKSIELKITNDGPQKFFGSPGYLSLVLNNIISNSIKHSPKGSLVDVYISQNPGGTLFSVADHGVGIEEEALPYIFDPFYREDTARNRKAGGTGIGLSLAKALVGLHGGDISVSSKIGHGSTFTVFIPFKILSNEEKEASKKSDAIKAMFAKKQLERGAPLTT